MATDTCTHAQMHKCTHASVYAQCTQTHTMGCGCRSTCAWGQSGKREGHRWRRASGSNSKSEMQPPLQESKLCQNSTQRCRCLISLGSSRRQPQRMQQAIAQVRNAAIMRSHMNRKTSSTSDSGSTNTAGSGGNAHGGGIAQMGSRANGAGRYSAIFGSPRIDRPTLAGETRRFGANGTEFGPISVKCGRTQAKNWPKSSRNRSTSPPSCSEYWAEVDPMSAKLGRIRRKFGRARADVGQMSLRFGPNWPNSGECRPNSGNLGATWTDVGPSSAEFDPDSARFGRTRVKLGPIRPKHSAEIQTLRKSSDPQRRNKWSIQPCATARKVGRSVGRHGFLCTHRSAYSKNAGVFPRRARQPHGPLVWCVTVQLARPLALRHALMTTPHHK